MIREAPDARISPKVIFSLPLHRCSVFQVLWPLYHRSVRMNVLPSETN
jgi:hypothetical protein